MSNKLTSLTGFGEGDPKPEKHGHFGKTTPKNEGERRFMGMMKKQKGPTFENSPAKSSALNKKMGKKDEKFVKQLGNIKEHVSGGKKSGGFKDPFWYSK